MALPKRAVVAFIGLFLFATTAVAQVDRGTITGIVTDASGAVIPGVAIKVTNQATGVVTPVITSSAGVYTAPLLQPGTYGVTAEKQGFKKFAQSGIVVGVGETVRANVAMAIGVTTETVQVSGQAVQIQRDSAELGTVVSGQEIEELPLTSVGDQRTPASFMKLSPGVTGRGNSDGGPGGNQYMTTSVGGSIVSSTTLKLDGADFPTATGFEGNLNALQIPPDAIGEFKLEATNPPAEYGRSVGGTASFVMKSGTNQIHGTAFEYVRNTALDANQWFTNASYAGPNPDGTFSGCEANGVTAPPAGYTGAFAACKSLSGRLEEMPGEEGYPAYLGSRLAEFYERAGKVVTLSPKERIGSVTVVGAVSPPGGDFSEPVSQNTLRVTRVFWALDANLAARRHFPSINWLTSYSLYTGDLRNWYQRTVAKDWPDMRIEALEILQKEAELQDIVQLVGYDALPESEKGVMDIAKMIREDYLQQSAYDPVDTFASIRKQYLMMKTILSFGKREAEAIKTGAQASQIANFPVKSKIAKMKWTPEDQFEAFVQDIDGSLDQEFGALAREIRA